MIFPNPQNPFDRPLGEQHGDEGTRTPSPEELEQESRERYQAMLEREDPEDMDSIENDTYILDLKDALLWALLKSPHAYDPSVINALGPLQVALQDRARELFE